MRVKQALLLVAGKKYFKFSIAICINCMGNMLIWGHFCGIMELLLHNYLGHGDILIIEKTFVSVFIESAIKPTSLLHADVQNALAYRMQLTKLAATWMFLWTRVTSHHSKEWPAEASNLQYALVLRVDSHPC